MDRGFGRGGMRGRGHAGSMIVRKSCISYSLLLYCILPF